MKTGLNSHRLIKDDPYHAKEVAFVEQINKELGYNDMFLNQICDSSGKTYLTEREEQVALSIIQWLGTPVGQGFLDKVQSKFNEK